VLDELERLAQDALGFESLTEAQRRAVSAVRDGRDALVVLPTGAGKSAIYQLAATVRDGAAVIVSPLLALQYDQRTAINASGLGAAESIDGSTPSTARRGVVERCARGETQFVFTTPETLLGGDVVDLLSHAGVGLLVVDEAHCVLTWGASFRPAYTSLRQVAERLGRSPIVALTASAGTADRAEIVERLGLHDPLVVVGGARRDNLAVAVHGVPSAADAIQVCVERVRDVPGTTMVFVADRRDATALAAMLDESSRPAVAYHGGLPRQARAHLDERLSSGERMTVVTTNALSLGIDAPSVRHVLHVGRPPTVDAYYQEIGRGGRDGEPAQCTLLDPVRDGGGRRAREAAAVTLDGEHVRAVHTAVHGGARTRSAVRARTGLGDAVVGAAISELQAIGAVDPRARGVQPGRQPLDLGDVDERCRRRTLVASARRAGMDQLVAHAGCRWQFLDAYFGAAVLPPCGICDRCVDVATDRRVDGCADGAAGRRVLHHPEFGRGTVASIHEGELSVSFDEAGFRVIDEGTARERGWLSAS
jgi:ATP-dependent DNA helicase RecQ